MPDGDLESQTTEETIDTTEVWQGVNTQPRRRPEQHQAMGEVSISTDELKRLQERDAELSRREAKDQQRYERLPNNIPVFSGRQADYLSWITSFKANIMDQRFTMKQQMATLVSGTKDVSDLQTVGLFAHTEEGLEQALKYIDDIYGDQDKIVDTAVQSLENVRQVRGIDSEAVSKIRAAFISAVTSAKLVNRIAEYRDRIKKALLSKLPLRLQLEISSNQDSTELQMKMMEETLTQEMKRLRELESHDIRGYQYEGRKRGNREVSSHAYKIQAREYFCQFDGGRHKYSDCPLTAEEKLRATYQQRRCLNCLVTGHRVQDCYSTRRCEQCRGKHHSFLCQAIKTKHTNWEERNKNDSPRTPPSNDTTVSKMLTPMCYKTITVKVNGEPLRILFDEGAGENFIAEAAAQRLKLTIREGPVLNIFGFGNHKATRSSRYVTANLRGNGGHQTIKTTLCIVPTIGSGKYPTPNTQIRRLLSETQRSTYHDEPNRLVEAIVGLLDSQLWLKESKLLMNDGIGIFSVQRTLLGTVIYGKQNLSQTSQVKMIFTPSELVQEVERSSSEDPDQYVETFIKDRVREVNGRIEVDIPLIGKLQLDSNSQRCYRQMLHNVKQWRKSNKFEVVKKIFEDWATNGIIEPVKDGQQPTHTLSYHVVTKLSSATTKHRIVFNGSLEDRHGHTLNDQLFKGQTTWNLVHSFVEFRISQYPLIGDLRQAFLMVQVNSADRNLFQFYWPSEIDAKKYRFARVPFGTSASPFLLYVSLRKIIQAQADQHPELKNLIQWFYVDDLVCSFDSADTRQEIQNDCTKVLGQYGFEIGWVDLTKVRHQSVLGIQWDIPTDTLHVKIETLALPGTLRQLASLIPGIFDPCGYLEPLIAGLRRIFSEVWRRTPDWEATLPAENVEQILNILNILQKQPYPVERWLGTDRNNQLDLHVFSDANDKSIGAVIYVKDPRNESIHLLLAKSILHTRRTIAEAELDAIVLGVKLVDTKLAHFTTSIHLWTDSLINFHRLSVKSVNQLKYQQARKVMNTWEVMNKYQTTVGHIESKENPADLLTKIDKKRFDWGKWQERNVPETGEFYTIVRHVRTQPTEDEEPQTEVLSFMEQANSLNECTQRYSLEVLIKATQRDVWTKEIEAMGNGHRLPKNSTLGLYWYELDAGILKARLRTDSVSNKIMLPTNSRLTELLCEDIHQKRGHNGADSVYTLFSQVYLSKGVRRLIRLMTARCETCRRLRGHPMSPGASPLQPFRLNPPERAFQYVGVDFAGPLLTTDGPRYILLFHCFHSRAVFLKLLPEQTTLGVLLTLKQLAARHGTPRFIYSDNATVFRKGERTLKQLYDQRNLAVAELEWKFSFPGDPTSNGATEVMVGLCKKFLRALSFGKSYRAMELDTYLAEAECGINNRPLYVHLGEVITPQHFLSGQTTLPIPQPDGDKMSTMIEKVPWTIRKRVEAFWRSWKNGYLYRMRHQQLPRHESTVQVGDKVIYEPHNLSDRAVWPSGVVTQVYPGEDDTIRLADVQLNSGTLLERRPVRKLILLERLTSRGGGCCEPTEQLAQRAESTGAEEESEDSQMTPRERRAVARAVIPAPKQ